MAFSAGDLDKYILDDDGRPVLEPDWTKWGEWFSTHNRQIAVDLLTDPAGKECCVSTVFLGLDCRFSPIHEGPPLLWETRVFDAEGTRYQQRYATGPEALNGHAECCRQLLMPEADRQLFNTPRTARRARR